MRTCRVWLGAIGWILGMTLALRAAPRPYETWTDPTNPAKTFRGRLVAVHGPIAFFETKAGRTGTAVLDSLPGRDAVRVADFLAAPGVPLATWATSGAAITRALRGSLIVLREGRLVDFDPGTQPEPEFYLVYFSAGWCGPCHQFTPLLKAAYEALRAESANDFEVVFVSSDETPKDMLGYMREMEMPWPAVAWKKRALVEAVTQFAGEGIPCLVVIDRDGHLLFHSFSGSEYLGAQDPLNRFKQLHDLCAPGNRQTAGIRYRFERTAYLGRNQAAAAPPKPYFMKLNPTRFRAQGVTRFQLLLSISADGEVTSARASGDIPAGLDLLAESEARKWVFFPAIKDGRFCAAEVVLPVEIPPAPPQP